MFGDAWRNAISGHAISSPADQYFLALMLCAAAESLLLELNQAVLSIQGASAMHANPLLDFRIRPAKNNSTCSSALTGVSFQQACQDQGLGRGIWRGGALVQTRNKFVHGTPPLENLKWTPESEDLKAMQAELFRAFRLVHNRYAARIPQHLLYQR